MAQDGTPNLRETDEGTPRTKRPVARGCCSALDGYESSAPALGRNSGTAASSHYGHAYGCGESHRPEHVVTALPQRCAAVVERAEPTARIEHEPRGASCGYSVFAVSSRDYAAISECLRAVFSEIRSIVAASEPADPIGLLNLQLVRWK